VAAFGAAFGAVTVAGLLGVAAMFGLSPLVWAPSRAPMTIVSAGTSVTPREEGVRTVLETSPQPPPAAAPALVSANAVRQVQASAGATVTVPPTGRAREARLQVTTSPPGARVTVDGIGWGRTPLTIEHLGMGSKTVRVTLDGFGSQQRLVDIRRDRAEATLHLTLDRAGNPGGSAR
jgi:hypothetical protein